MASLEIIINTRKGHINLSRRIFNLIKRHQGDTGLTIGQIKAIMYENITDIDYRLIEQYVEITLNNGVKRKFLKKKKNLYMTADLPSSNNWNGTVLILTFIVICVTGSYLFLKDYMKVFAPKAARGPNVDLSKVPTREPYTAFLENLPYDITDDDIVMFFKQLKVKNVRLPRENGDKGRIRGFGYAEFFNRQDLIQALATVSMTLKNRAIKVTLAGEHDGDRDRRDGGVDRTLGDWRADKKDQFSRDDARSDRFSSRGTGFSDREPYRARSNYDGSYDRFERNGDKSDYSFRNRDFGRDQDRRSSDRDRGYGFSDREFQPLI